MRIDTDIRSARCQHRPSAGVRPNRSAMRRHRRTAVRPESALCPAAAPGRDYQFAASPGSGRLRRSRTEEPLPQITVGASDPFATSTAMHSPPQSGPPNLYTDPSGGTAAQGGSLADARSATVTATGNCGWPHGPVAVAASSAGRRLPTVDSELKHRTRRVGSARQGRRRASMVQSSSRMPVSVKSNT